MAIYVNESGIEAIEAALEKMETYTDNPYEIAREIEEMLEGYSRDDIEHDGFLWTSSSLNDSGEIDSIELWSYHFDFD